MITKEELEFLKGYETNFKTAMFSDYSRNVQKSILEKMVSIYDRERGTKTHMSYSCAGCQLAFLKRMGNLYFQSKQVAEEPEPEVTTNKIAKKATNKKKNTKRNGNKGE